LEARHDAYPPPAQWRRPGWALVAAMDAFSRVREVNAHASSVAFVQRNLLSTLVTAEPWLRRPFVFDVDDAIFLGTRGQTADTIARRAALILCGNHFLADHFRAFGKVRVVPTAVDADVFTPRLAPPQRPAMGWSGSSSGLPYLYAIEPALIALVQRYPDMQLIVVSNAPPKFQRFPNDHLVYVPWQPSIEASVLHRFTVGLMPLEDTPWSRGKCSFKMLTYMASGVPVVVSPVGMNAEVLALGPCGLGATTHDEWVHAIAQIIEQPSTAQAMGQHGRAIVEQHFARAPVGRQLDAALREIAAGG
jgi:glycosyltransferase involved in cell wall biosynthesis